ncbi:TOMM precursor leader peptide-binding protein [Streptomyces sp. F63]|uniref:TOMM precursor leader peptide-binding protein n=1 Tax=Streptomyces sp. F63 TaxID=2824887 RepID=UPI001B377DFD|nr:TOMM precursor leader peptide-binding protein [Streptomyces sp. F63]MBQ0987100.1 TOMM precursor leader peptide-binding protein [Streptomyces sp. F63]
MAADVTGTAPTTGTATAPATGTFEALAGTRPRVRRDVLFTETPGGVLFHNADGGFHLTGRAAYRFAALMVPHLAGRNRLGEICEGFGPAQRAMAAELVKTLYERGFARDVPDADADGPEPGDVSRRFAAQIAYVDHYTDGAPRRFARFRATRVAVLGEDETARWCALSLVRNGCGHIATTAAFPEVEAEAAEAAADGCPVRTGRLDGGGTAGGTAGGAAGWAAGWAALDGYDVVVVTGPGAEARAHRLLCEGVPEGRVLIPAWTFGGRAVTGPLSTATSTGCLHCALLRLGGSTDAAAAAEIWSGLAGGSAAPAPGAGGPLTGPVAAMAGNLLGYEIFRLRTGALPAETAGQVLVQDLESLDVMAEPLHPHPRCRRCAAPPAGAASGAPGLPEVPERLVLPVTPTVETAREAEDLVEELNRISGALVRPYTGVFRRYDDEELTQTPLKISRVEAALGHGARRAIAAFDVHHLAGARMRALYAAAEAYVEHVVPVVPASPAPAGDGPGAAPVPALAPDALTTGGGTGRGTEEVTAWVTAVSLLTREPVRVPAAAVRPFGPYNRDRLHQASSAGAGAGGGPGEAAGRGLLSALAHDALLRAVRGTTEVTPLGAAEDPELVFLLKSAGNLDLTVELLDLGEDARSSARVVLAREPEGRWAVAAGLSRSAAACAALRDLLGQAQLAAEEPEKTVDQGDPLLADLAPAAIAVTAGGAADGGGNGSGSGSGSMAPDAEATTFEAVLDRLRAAGRDVLYADTTPADLPAGGISTARVLLTTGAAAGAAPGATTAARAGSGGGADDH